MRLNYYAIHMWPHKKKKKRSLRAHSTPPPASHSPRDSYAILIEAGIDPDLLS